MPWEVRSKNGKFYVVNKETNAVRGRGYDDETDAEDKVDDYNFREETRGHLSRIPKSEMTAEEKAAAYDKLIAEQAQRNDANLPPKQGDTKNDPPPNPPKRRITYWGDAE